MSWNWSSAEGALGALLGTQVEPGASERCASERDRELIQISASYDELDSVIRSAGPAVLRAGSGWVALLRAGPFRARILTSRGPRSLPRATLRRALEAQLRQADGGVGAEARVADALALLPAHLARNERVREAFTSRWATGIRFDIGFLVRPPPARSPVRLASEVRLLRSGVGVAILQVMRFVLVLGSWAIIGRGALSGRMDTVAFLAWVGVLISALPMRGMLGALTGELRVGLGVLLEQRLFAGVLAIDPDEIRSDGIGRMMGRVHEAREWQRHTIAALIGATAASVDFALAAISLFAGGGLALVGLLASWLALSLAVGYAVYQIELALARARLGLTADLVERFVGQRTRLVQEPPSARFVAEDRSLAEYAAVVERRDLRLATLAVAATHGWRLVALAAAAEVVLVGADAQPLALIVGGMLFGDAAFSGLFGVTRSIAAALSSWDAIGHIYHAAERLPARAPMPPVQPATLNLHKVGFRYPGSERWTFRGLDWRVSPGDRVLLSGTSGAGKSTLAALLAGLRVPNEGVLLLDGLDLPSVGVRTWRRRVVCVPQFHQNHVFADTFGFNVLMGAGWPPTRRELRQAGELCAELGLGHLLNSMPSGVSQAVGDSGWQLSHGERARLYLARALAQQPAVLVVDESFGALDPITLDWVLEALERRAIALVVIAHP